MMETSGERYTESHVKINRPPRADDGLNTMPECIKYYAELLGDEESVVFAEHDGGRQVVTWKELYEKSVSTARSLLHLGVQKGELIAVNIRNCPEWMYITFGTMFAGATPACIAFTYKDGSDLIAVMEQLRTCSMLAMDPGQDGGNWTIVQNLVEEHFSDGRVESSKMPSLRYLIGHEVGSRVMEGVKPLAELVSEDHSDVVLPEVKGSDLALLAQTSGSTGVPKLVAHTHTNLLTMRQLTKEGFFDKTLVHYNDRPFAWMGGLPLQCVFGQKRVTVSGFYPEPKDIVSRMIDIVSRERCTYMTVLPPMLHALIDRQDELPTDWPLKTVATGGQPLTQGIAKAIGKVAGSLTSGYGGTEVLFCSTVRTSDKTKFEEFKAGKIGDIPGLEVKIVDDDGAIVPVNTKGDILVRSPMVFKGYYNDPEKTATVMTSDGWYKTDDIGLMDENGELYVYGRKSNMIISGGMNVTPEILEHAMEKCPDVATVVIVPVPDDVYYQVLCACVIRKDGSTLNELQLRKFCEEMHNDTPRLFTVLPKYYMFLDKFPLTNTGKTFRPKLARMAADKFKLT